MEYLKQFEMNKIGTFKKAYFTWNSFRPFSCLIYIIKKYPTFNVNKMMSLNKDIGCFQLLFLKYMFKYCH